MTEAPQQPTKSALDKLVGTIRLAIILGLIGLAIYFGPTLLGKVQESVKEIGKQKEAIAREQERQLFQFSARLDAGSVYHDVYCTNRGPVVLENVQMTLTVTFSNGTQVSGSHSVARWGSGEELKVTWFANRGAIRKYELSGTATVEGKNRPFSWASN